MELWIRSQDKMNLVKIRQIGINYQDNKQIIANYTPELYENSGGYYELLGTYKTKERALEVLDEIEKELYNSVALITNNEGYLVDIANKGVVIYQMPKE